MSPEELLAAIAALTDGLKTELTTQVDAMNKRCDALVESLAKKKSDEAGSRSEENDEMRRQGEATRVAADAVDPAAFASLASRVNEMAKRQSRPMADLNAFADAQAKADAVMRANGDSASPPMSGEDIVAYQIRLARPMQRLSQTWKNVDLALIAADRNAFNIALDGIRSDAMAASMNFDSAPEFAHRMVTKTMPGGHVCKEFYGRGTFIKAMSRPVRHVAFIGTRSSARH
jgi:hypothetical protein